MEMPATKTTISLRHKRNIRERVNLVGRLQYVLLQSYTNNGDNKNLVIIHT